MNLLEVRDRIRDVAQSVGLTYTEIETLADVNEVLDQTMPCLFWLYSGENNTYSDSDTQMDLDIYILDNWHQSQLVETGQYERDFIVTEKNKLRGFYISFLSSLGVECGSDYMEVVSDNQIPLAEKISIEGFNTFNMRITISKSRGYCIDVESCETPPHPMCPPTNYLVEYANGTIIEQGSINSGLDLEVIVPDPDTCDPASYIVEYENGTPIESGTIPSGGNKTIEVPDPLVFIDPTYLVEYTDGELISSGTLGSGDNLVVQVPKTLTIDLPYLDGDITNTYPIVSSNTYGTINTITTTLTNFVIKLDGVVVTTPFVISALNSEITTEHDAATSNGTIELGGLGD